MNKINAFVGKLLEALLLEAKLTVGAVTERGLSRFGRVLAIAICLAWGAYRMIYVPAVAKKDLYDRELKTAKMVARYEDQYKSLESSINAAVPMLAPLKDREAWLSKAVLGTLSGERLESETISAVNEQSPRGSGIIIQSVTVKFKTHFKEFVSWLERVEQAERTKPLLYISGFKLSKSNGFESPKSSNDIGVNEIECSIDDFLDGNASAGGGR